MTNDEDSKTPYKPLFLHPEDEGSPESSRSVDQPISDREDKPKIGNYIEYGARLDDLRLMAPYLAELKKRLGESCYVLQFKGPFTLDGVPNEFKSKDRPLLWKVKTNGSVGWVTDQDLKTFYFGSQEQSLKFIREVEGEHAPTPLAEALESRDNLNKLLW